MLAMLSAVTWERCCRPVRAACRAVMVASAITGRSKGSVGARIPPDTAGHTHRRSLRVGVRRSVAGGAVRALISSAVPETNMTSCTRSGAGGHVEGPVLSPRSQARGGPLNGAGNGVLSQALVDEGGDRAGRGVGHPRGDVALPLALGDPLDQGLGHRQLVLQQPRRAFPQVVGQWAEVAGRDPVGAPPAPGRDLLCATAGEGLLRLVHLALEAL